MSWSFLEPLLDFLELVPDADATGSEVDPVRADSFLFFAVDSPSLLLLRRLLFRFEPSFAPFCGEFSPDVLEEGLLGSAISSGFLRLLPYPELDIAAVLDFLLRFVGASVDSVASCSSVSSALGRLVRLLSF